MTGKREDYISWDEYFMGVALLSAQRSKDPSTQAGACIIDEDKKIVGIGYNGAPIGFPDSEMNWGVREGGFLDTKYQYICHAELNAIINSTKENLKGCTIYITLSPCNECTKAIIQSGIKKVIYLSDKHKALPPFVAGKKMLDVVGIEHFKMDFDLDKLTLNFK